MPMPCSTALNCAVPYNAMLCRNITLAGVGVRSGRTSQEFRSGNGEAQKLYSPPHVRGYQPSTFVCGGRRGLEKEFGTDTLAVRSYGNDGGS